MTESLPLSGYERSLLARIQYWWNRYWLWVLCGVAYVVFNTLLVPTATYSYDEAGLLGGANDWLRYGLPLFQPSKVGIEIPVLAFLAESIAHLLRLTNMLSGVAAIHIAWKLPLLTANLLTALSLARLARRFGIGRPRLLACVWLFNPVVFWVAAGHGQIEPLSVCAAIVAVDLLLSDWPTMAGLVCGIGAAIEYFPLTVTVAAIFLLLQGRLRLRATAKFFVGAACSLSISFWPLVQSSAGRTLSAVLGGTVPPHGPSGSVLSPWGLGIWLLPHMPNPSLPIVATVGILATALIFTLSTLAVQRGVVSAERAACGVVGLLLVVIPLVDPVSSPQYALITAGGLYMLVVALDLPVWIAAVLPLAGLATYFAFASPWVFFLGFWARLPIHLPHLPISSNVAIILARSFTIGSLGVFMWGLTVPLRSKSIPATAARHGQPQLALGFGVFVCAILASLGAVPAFWSAMGPSGPKYPIDLSRKIAFSSQYVRMTPNTIILQNSPELFKWASEGSVKPVNTLIVRPGRLGAPATSSVTNISNTSRWSAIRLRLPEAKGMQSYWIRLLVGSSSWKTSQDLPRSPIKFVVNSVPITASSVVFSTPTWAVVTLNVPTRIVDKSGSLVMSAPPEVTKWDSWGPVSSIGTAAGAEFVGGGNYIWRPIVNIYPAQGSFSAEMDGVTQQLQFNSTAPGDNPVNIVISRLPLRPNVSLSRASLPFAVASVVGEELQFPPNERLHHQRALVIFGSLWLAALICTAGITLAYFGRGDIRSQEEFAQDAENL